MDRKRFKVIFEKIKSSRFILELKKLFKQSPIHGLSSLFIFGKVLTLLTIVLLILFIYFTITEAKREVDIVVADDGIFTEISLKPIHSENDTVLFCLGFYYYHIEPYLAKQSIETIFKSAIQYSKTRRKENLSVSFIIASMAMFGHYIRSEFKLGETILSKAPSGFISYFRNSINYTQNVSMLIRNLSESRLPFMDIYEDVMIEMCKLTMIEIWQKKHGFGLTLAFNTTSVCNRENLYRNYPLKRGLHRHCYNPQEFFQLNFILPSLMNPIGKISVSKESRQNWETLR